MRGYNTEEKPMTIKEELKLIWNGLAIVGAVSMARYFIGIIFYNN